MRQADCLRLAEAPFAVLSGGEKQRVSLARCLAQQARIFLLDEPASHLDRRSKAEFMAILRRCNRDQGVTIVLVSHEHHDSLGETDGLLRVLLGDGSAGNTCLTTGAPIHGEADR